MSPNMAPRSNSVRQIVGLDFIRFGTALFVMYHHYGWRVWANDFAVPMNYTYLGRSAGWGFVGVQIFFVLSGFVIAYTAQNATAAGFLKSRVTRLYPAAWICSTLTVAIFYALGRQHLLLGGTAFNEHLFRNWSNSLVLWPLGPWIDAPYWTLGVELAFYSFILALLHVHLYRYISLIISVVGCASVAYSVVLVAGYLSMLPSWSHPTRLVQLLDGPSWQVTLLPHGSFFAIGVLLWLCLFERTTPSRLAVIAVAVAGSVAEIALRTGLDRTWIVPTLIWLLAVLAMILSVVHNARIHAAIGPGGIRIARRLGLVTYPLYLIHQSVGFALMATLKPYLPDLLNLVITAALVLSLAFAINLFLEAPLQQVLRRFLHGTPKLMAQPAASAP